MENEKKERYAELILNAYNENIFKITWSTIGFSINIEKPEQFPKMKDKDFQKYIFSIINLVAKLAEKEDLDGENEKDLAIAKEIYLRETDLKDHLYIKKNSKIDCFESLEYEIISHRDKDDAQKIAATSAILKITTEKSRDESICAFEISERDLNDMIQKLDGLREKIHNIRTEDKI